MGNKQHEATPSRQRILQAAVSLFAKQGYGNTGLRELAAAAEVNLAMINYFFGSKKALLKEILDIFFSGYIEVAKRELPGQETLPVRLHRFIHGAVEYFASHRDYLLVTITELPHDDPEIIEHKANWGRQMVATVGTYLTVDGEEDTSQAEPHPLAVPPVVFCSLLTSMMASRFLFTPVMEQVQPDQLAAVSTEKYADIISRIFLQGAGSVLGPLREPEKQNRDERC